MSGGWAESSFYIVVDIQCRIKVMGPPTNNVCGWSYILLNIYKEIQYNIPSMES